MSHLNEPLLDLLRNRENASKHIVENTSLLKKESHLTCRVIDPLDDDAVEKMLSAHLRGELSYLSYSSDLSHIIGTCNRPLSFRPIIKKNIDVIEKEKINSIFKGFFIEKVCDVFHQKYHKKIKELHHIAIKKTLNNPFNLIYINGELSSFLSWEEKKGEFVTSTHWISNKLEKKLRIEIHRYFFRYLKNMGHKKYIASVFVKNKRSLNFFIKNKYVPLYARVFLL